MPGKKEITAALLPEVEKEVLGERVRIVRGTYIGAGLSYLRKDKRATKTHQPVIVKAEDHYISTTVKKMSIIPYHKYKKSLRSVWQMIHSDKNTLAKMYRLCSALTDAKGSKVFLSEDEIQQLSQVFFNTLSAINKAKADSLPTQERCTLPDSEFI